MIPVQVINMAANTLDIGLQILVSISILCGVWLVSCMLATVCYIGTNLLWKLSSQFSWRRVL